MTSALPLFLAATCVTHVEQKGPEGPWVGQVANTGDQPVLGALAAARVYDSDGVDVFGMIGSRACPETLLPGQLGAFELDPIADSGPDLEINPPLRAEFAPFASVGEGFGTSSGDGLHAELESTLDQGRVANIRISNNSDRTYTDVRVCAVRFTVSGAIASVTFADSDERIASGDSTVLSLFFDERIDGTLRVYPSGQFEGDTPDCCPHDGPSTWRSVDTGPFSVLLPPDWTYEPSQGIDSFVGTFVGGGITLHFDYGFHSDPLTSIAPALHDVHLETIGGRSAKVVRYNTEIVGPHTTPVTGVHFFEVTRETVGLEQLPVRLTVSAVMAASDRQAIAFHIFRSIRFDAP